MTSQVPGRVFSIDGSPDSGGCAVAGNLNDMNAVKHRCQRALCAVQDRFHITGLPPHAFLLQQIVSDCALGLVFGRFGQLFVATEDDYTHPFLRAHPFVRFDADQRVGAHPVDLLPNRGKAIQGIILVGEIDWHYVGLIPLGTR